MYNAQYMDKEKVEELELQSKKILNSYINYKFKKLLVEEIDKKGDDFDIKKSFPIIHDKILIEVVKAEKEVLNEIVNNLGKGE